MNILLLEDDVALNKAITKVTKLDKHHTSSYYNGQDVYDDLNFDFDLYILDINVPNINGLELLSIIQAKSKSSKVIIISSNTDIKSLQSAYNLGCIDYIKKPFHLEELRIKIAKIDSISAYLPKQDSLTKKEKLLLELFIKNQNTHVSYEMIEQHVYKDKYMSMDGLRAMIKRLRSKLKDYTIDNVLEEGYTITLKG